MDDMIREAASKAERQIAADEERIARGYDFHDIAANALELNRMVNGAGVHIAAVENKLREMLPGLEHRIELEPIEPGGCSVWLAFEKMSVWCLTLEVGNRHVIAGSARRHEKIHIARYLQKFLDSYNEALRAHSDRMLKKTFL